MLGFTRQCLSASFLHKTSACVGALSFFHKASALLLRLLASQARSERHWRARQGPISCLPCLLPRPPLLRATKLSLSNKPPSVPQPMRHLWDGLRVEPQFVPPLSSRPTLCLSTLLLPEVQEDKRTPFAPRRACQGHQTQRPVSLTWRTPWLAVASRESGAPGSLRSDRDGRYKPRDPGNGRYDDHHT
ncbi:hypothetical protein B0T10DRAFT_279823 [Thelonectria olida]|uniref:Uncharacterized protein n=1 Tax=Thelonectria olida TaxID=1576542 RepID=A0A9P9AIF2_9HYPO|nr:hypothetical protein B0T10DRAFT_279823 [Thelonectria olida]